MNKRYIIADTHFNHANIIKYESRPFSDVGEMNDRMIKSWNGVVGKDDKIFFLGDFGFGKKEQLTELCNQLNGKKYMILGNHDRRFRPSVWREIGFEEVSKYPIIIGGFVILSHEPVYLNDHMPYVNLHGHIHSKTMNSNQYFNVSVECCDYIPLNLDKLINDLTMLNMKGK